MLYTLFLILLFIDSVLLIVAILLQAGQGGGLAASFGGVSSSASAFLGTRQTGNLLTKASWWMGGIFLGLAFLLSLMSSSSRTPRSVLDQAFPNAPAPAPVTAPANVPSAVPLQAAPPQGAAPAPGTKAPARGTKTPPKK